MGKAKKSNNLAVFLASRTGRKFFNILYSVGASIVILGALAKIIHLPFGNELLVIGMVTEAFVFFVSAFDNEQVDYVEESSGAGVTVIGGTGTTTAAGVAVSSSSPAIQGGQGRVAGGTTIIGGGGSIGGGTGGVVQGGGNIAAAQGGVSGGTTVVGGGSFGGASGGTAQVGGSTGGVSTGGSAFNAGNFSPEYIEQMDNVAKEMEGFSKVMSSASASLAGVESAEGTTSVGFFDNMKALNENVANMNIVYENQLKSVGNQMDTIKHINDSLERIRALYDNTVMDSNAFRYENERMTRQIQELNKVYARLLQAMNAGSGYNPTGGSGYNPSL